jgi:hypothetical protein
MQTCFRSSSLIFVHDEVDRRLAIAHKGYAGLRTSTLDTALTLPTVAVADRL